MAPGLLRVAVAAGPVQKVSQEYVVKAAFLFYLAEFVTWPEPLANAGGPMIFGILGIDPFGPMLDQTLSRQTVNGRHLEVQRISKMSEASKCQVLFVSASEEARLPLLWDVLRDASVLTVSDLPGFSSRGGMVGFVDQASKIRFAVSLKAMTAAHLKASSQLLGLALEVER